MSSIRILLLIGTLCQLSGCALFYNYDAISEKPLRGGLSEPIAPSGSTIQPALTMPLADLEEAANVAAGKVLPFSGNGNQRLAEFEVRDPIFHSCLLCGSIDANWNYTVSKPSRIKVSGGQDLLSIVLPARVEGRGGLGGDLAHLIAVDEKSFLAAANIDLGMRLRANRQYCLEVQADQPSYSWTDGPSVDVVGQNCLAGVCFGPLKVDIRDQIDPTIRQQLPTVAAGLQGAIPCGPIRESISKVWRGYSLPVKLPYQDLYLNISPKALYFPGLGVTTTDLVFAGRLDATVALEATPGSNAPLPLPINNPLPITPGRFSLAVPISTPYYTFEALATQLLQGRRYTAQTPIGNVTVLPRRVEVFPSGEKIALGISFEVQYQYLFLNTSGTIWLTAKPTTKDNGRRIRLEEIVVTRKFSSPIWEFASALLQEKVVAAAQDGFELDMNPPLSSAEADLTRIINEAGQSSGIALSAKDVKLSVGRILTNDKLFQLEALLDASVEAKLGSIRIREGAGQ
jgi:Domain of unknown function (DUF4403)